MEEFLAKRVLVGWLNKALFGQPGYCHERISVTPMNNSYDTRLTEAVNRLKKNDHRLAAIINRIGPCDPRHGTRGFTALVSSIIGQQLSRDAARAIRRRVTALFRSNEINPEGLGIIGDDELREAGLSVMKIGYLRDLAKKILTGKIDLQNLESMDDEDVITTLSRVRGIGRWTAEMYLMFSLERLDVFPIDDGSIRTAMMRIYNLPETNINTAAKSIAERWRPFRSIACWYLYAFLDMPRSKESNTG